MLGREKRENAIVRNGHDDCLVPPKLFGHLHFLLGKYDADGDSQVAMIILKWPGTAPSTSYTLMMMMMMMMVVCVIIIVVIMFI